MHPADDSNEPAPLKLQASFGQGLIPDPLEAELLPERVKLQAEVGIERVVPILVLIAFLLIIIGPVLGPSRRSSGLFSQKTACKIAATGGGLVALAGLIWLAFDNHYVLDRRSRRILLHKGIRFFGEEELLCEAHEVRRIGLISKPKINKGQHVGWEYTPVLLLRGKDDITLSTWIDRDLPSYNHTIRRWAAALQCECVECPKDREFDPRTELG